MDDYVSKPIGPGELARALGAVGRPADEAAEGAVDDEAEETAHGPSEPPFDLPAALQRIDGDAELLAELSGMFLGEVPSVLEEMDRAWTAGDAEALAVVAHRLKGSVSNFSARGSFAEALSVETEARSGRLAAAGEALGRLRVEIGRLSVALEPFARCPAGQNC